jgi:hypothetical protein
VTRTNGRDTLTTSHLVKEPKGCKNTQTQGLKEAKNVMLCRDECLRISRYIADAGSRAAAAKIRESQGEQQKKSCK